MTARSPGAAMILVATLLGACGSPSGPVEIPPEDLPFALERSPTPFEPPAERAAFTVFFVEGTTLVPVARNLDADVPAPEAAMRALLEGTTEAEGDMGITSRIPPSTRLLGLVVVDQVADVDLSAEFQGPASPEDILLRVAQVVFTLVHLPDVSAVRFAIEGAPVSVVTDRGTAVDRPVSAPDYASVAPPSPVARLSRVAPPE